RRPSRRSYSGVVRPSTTLKIQMNAATLMKSGTSTKKPAMKLRRSQYMLKPGKPASSPHHPRNQRHADDNAIPRKQGEAGSSDDGQEWTDDERGRDERGDKTDGDLQ